MLARSHLAAMPFSGAPEMSTGGERVAPAVGVRPSTGMSASTPPSVDERQLRYQIDRAVGRALFDHTFAARLLAEPALAVDVDVCGQAQCLGVRHIGAQDLHDFARQIFDQFWGPAHQ